MTPAFFLSISRALDLSAAKPIEPTDRSPLFAKLVGAVAEGRLAGAALRPIKA